MGKPKLALADFKSILLQPFPADPYTVARYYSMTAETALVADDHEAYQQVSREMVERMAKMLAPISQCKDYHNLRSTVWTSVIGAGAVDEPTVLLQMADRAFEIHQSRLDANVLGGLQLRLGKFSEAKRQLEPFANDLSSQLHPPIYTWYLLAMVEHRLGNHDAARAWLDKAREERRIQLSIQMADFGSLVYWNRTIDLLENEARALITPDSAINDMK
jgi:hypothetical protein